MSMNLTCPNAMEHQNVECGKRKLFYIGKNLWSGFSDQNTRQLSIVISVVIIILLLPLINKLMPTNIFPEEYLWTSILIPILMIFGGLFYLWLRKILFQWLKINEELNYKRPVKVTKIYFGFLSLSIFSAVINIIMAFAKKEPGSKNALAEPTMSLILIAVTLLIVSGIYRISVKRFTTETPIEHQDHVNI